MHIRNLTGFLLVLAAVGGASQARAKVARDVSGSLKTIISISGALDSPDRHPVHILYVHGISQVGAGDSAALRIPSALCSNCATSPTGKMRGLSTPTRASSLLALIRPRSPTWEARCGTTTDEWQAAAPFVVHWVVHLRRHPAVS